MFFTGCMAERLKTKLLETNKMIDLVVGPGKLYLLSISRLVQACSIQL